MDGPHGSRILDIDRKGDEPQWNIRQGPRVGPHNSCGRQRCLCHECRVARLRKVAEQLGIEIIPPTEII